MAYCEDIWCKEWLIKREEFCLIFFELIHSFICLLVYLSKEWLGIFISELTSQIFNLILFWCSALRLAYIFLLYSLLPVPFSSWRLWGGLSVEPKIWKHKSHQQKQEVLKHVSFVSDWSVYATGEQSKY